MQTAAETPPAKTAGAGAHDMSVTLREVQITTLRRYGYEIRASIKQAVDASGIGEAPTLRYVPDAEAGRLYAVALATPQDGRTHEHSRSNRRPHQPNLPTELVEDVLGVSREDVPEQSDADTAPRVKVLAGRGVIAFERPAEIAVDVGALDEDLEREDLFVAGALDDGGD